MKTIWKIPFEIKEFQQLDVPRAALPLHVGLDPKGLPAIWFEVEADQVLRPLVIYVIGTGQRLPTEAAQHLGSFVWPHNSTVWHVYTV